MDQQENRTRQPERSRAGSQRADLRRLRAKQVGQQEHAQTWHRKGLPMWARTLIAVAAVLLLLLVFFRVDEFEVSGNVRYTADEVADASGVTLGDVLMGVNKTQAASRILVKLPYVRQVVVSKELPSTVRFEIQECTAVAAAESETGPTWLINEDGKLLEKLAEDAPVEFPKIQGVELLLPVPGDQAVFSDDLQQERAMEAVIAVRDAGLISQIYTIDVSDPEDIILSYLDRIEVHVGDGTDVDYKLQYMLGCFERLGDSARGMLDLSFSTGNQAIFHPVE